MIVLLALTASGDIVFQDSSNAVRTSSDSATYTSDSAHSTGQELKQCSFLPSQSFNGTCQSPCSVPHKEELPTQTDEAPDLSTQSKPASDTSWFSSQDGCKQSEEVTCCTKPQYVMTTTHTHTHTHNVNVTNLLLRSSEFYSQLFLWLLDAMHDLQGNGFVFRSGIFTLLYYKHHYYY